MRRASIAAVLLTVALWVVTATSSARAQRLVAHDTLSDSTPTAVTCGFCVTEGFGVIFRELPPPLQGIDPADFPLELREVQIALAAAHTTGTAPSYACAGDAAGGTADLDVEVWAGAAAPTGDIHALPGAAEAWSAGETLVWAGTVSIELSVPETDGASLFRLTVNRLPVVNEDGSPIVIAAPSTYVRVVAWLTPGGSSTLCDAQGLESPSGVPVRDNDSVIADERSFLYAAGAGWLWSEDAGIGGDWAIRLLVVPSAAPRDGGTIGADGGPSEVDAATVERDAGGGSDAGTSAGGSGGCGCRASGAGGGGAATIALGLALSLLRLSRRLSRRVS